MQEIQVPLDQLLAMRRSKNFPLFAKMEPDTEGDSSKDGVTLLVQAAEGVLLSSHILAASQDWASLQGFVNKPLSLYDKRMTTHDLASTSEWPLVNGVPDSAYHIAPTAGMKFYVTYVQVRFPVNAKLTGTNKLYFKVYLNLGAGPVLVINLEYENMYELVKKSNSPLQILPGSISAISTADLVEIEFKYACPHTLEGSPIVLRSSLGEYMEIGITGDGPVCNINDQPLADRCWAVINGKQCLDF